MNWGAGRSPSRGAIVAAATIALVLAALFVAACGTSTGPSPAPPQSVAAQSSPSATATQAAASSAESVLVAREDGSRGRPGAGRTVASQGYDLAYADYRAFAQPALSPNGKWVLSGVTGGDVRVTYTLTDTQMGVDWLSVFCVTPRRTAGRQMASTSPSPARAPAAAGPDLPASGSTTRRTGP
jgi:hypothetical protein